MTVQILKSAVVEIRFPLVLQFKDKAMPFFQNHVAQFNKIQLDENKNINLIDDTNTCRIFCEKQRAGVVAENDAEMVNFNRLTAILEALLKKLDLTSLQFIGVRTWFLTTPDDVKFEELKTRYARTLLNLDMAERSMPRFTDFAIVYESTSNDSVLRLTTGVVDKNEIQEKHSEFQFDKDPDVAILHDIDNVALKIPREKFKSTLNAQIAQNHKLAHEMKEQLNDILRS